LWSPPKSLKGRSGGEKKSEKMKGGRKTPQPRYIKRKGRKGRKKATLGSSGPRGPLIKKKVKNDEYLRLNEEGNHRQGKRGKGDDFEGKGGLAAQGFGMGAASKCRGVV